MVLQGNPLQGDKQGAVCNILITHIKDTISSESQTAVINLDKFISPCHVSIVISMTALKSGYI